MLQDTFYNIVYGRTWELRTHGSRRAGGRTTRNARAGTRADSEGV